MTWDSSAILYATARWLNYLAVFIVVGAGVFRWLVLPRAARQGGSDPRPARRAATMARVAAVVLAVSLLARLYWQTRSLLEPDESISPDILRVLLETQWGTGWLAQGAAALVTLMAWRALGRRPPSRSNEIAAAIGVLGLIFTAPLTGHAVGLPAAGVLGYPLTVVHVGAGATWLGTLGVMLLTSLRRPRGPDSFSTAALVGAYSPIALISGLGVMGAGVIISWRYVGSWQALFSSPYGQTLLLKIGTLVGVAATGFYNWRVLLPKLRNGKDVSVDRTAAVELLVGTVLLALTAVLVSMEAPAE